VTDCKIFSRNAVYFNLTITKQEAGFDMWKEGNKPQL